MAALHDIYDCMLVIIYLWHDELDKVTINLLFGSNIYIYIYAHIYINNKYIYLLQVNILSHKRQETG